MRREDAVGDVQGELSMPAPAPPSAIFDVGGGPPDGAPRDSSADADADPAGDGAPSPHAPLPSSLLAWVDGREVDPTLPWLSVLDRGFTLADGLFETMRAVGGTVFRLRPHLDRLRAGAAALRIALPDDIDLDDLAAAAMRRAADVGLADAALRLTVSRGAAALGLGARAARATVVLVVQPMPRFAPDLYDRGITAAIADGRRNERAMTAGLKTLAYTDAIMALAEAHARGADDALVLDTEGHLAEGSSSNVFLVLGRTLATPPLSCGVLPGVTRAVVLELARGMGTAVAERALVRRELRAAHEIFLTSSLRGIAPVVRVVGDAGGELTVGDGAPGPVTRALMAAYADLVRRETSPYAGGAP